ncbi:MAG: HAD family phosphatase [Nanoarchaeota archaeon]|nr:HAD family phosphatase [Nanoarchaeota archaeon]
MTKGRRLLEMIKAIIFDIGGVVYVGKQRAQIYMQEKLGLSREIWEKAARQIWKNLSIGIIYEKNGLLEMAKNLEIDKNKLKKLWIKAFKVRFILNKDLLNIIKRLRKNYKTAILSNQWSIPYNLQLTKEIKSYFDILVFSHEVGFMKPSVEIYNITLKKLQLKSNECIFIDDLEENLFPAKKIGIKTILFKNNKQLVNDLKKLGVEI